MKPILIFLSLLLITITSFPKTLIKNPIVIEVITKYTSIDDALQAAKNACLNRNLLQPMVSKKADLPQHAPLVPRRIIMLPMLLQRMKKGK